MKTLLIIGTLLTAVFGFSVSAYLIQYKFKVENLFIKACGFLTLGMIFTFATFVLALMAVWPPYF